jgi:hypothetical protein
METMFPNLKSDSDTANKMDKDGKDKSNPKSDSETTDKMVNVDGRKVFLPKFDLFKPPNGKESLKPDGPGESGDFNVSRKDHETIMMKIINYHIHIIGIILRMEQLNIGITISKHTQLKKSCMSWRGVIKVLQMTPK